MINWACSFRLATLVAPNFVLENNKLRRHYFILATSLSDVTSAGLFSKTKRGNWSPCSRVVQTVFYAGNTETKLFLATTKMEDSSNKYGQSSSIHACVSVYLAFVLSELLFTFSP